MEPKMDKTDARQGVTGKGGRRILIVSVALAVLAVAIVATAVS